MNTLITALAAHDTYGGPGAWWPVFPLMWFAFIVIVILLMTRIGRRRWRDCGPASGRSRLADRFAGGEIDETEYRTRLAVLEENRKSGGR